MLQRPVQYRLRSGPNQGSTPFKYGTEREPPNKHKPTKTGYRLPRLSGPQDVDEGEENYQNTEEIHKVWGRHGYEYFIDQNTLSVLSPQIYASPRNVHQDTPKANLIISCHPKFNHAMISPTKPPLPKYFAGNVSDHALYRHMVQRNRAQQGYYKNFRENEFDILGSVPSPSPMPSRLQSPAKSSHSIQWTLSPMKKLHYDRKGGRKAQGPFSREFTVTCMAPSNWLRMKWGRSQTTLV